MLIRHGLLYSSVSYPSVFTYEIIILIILIFFIGAITVHQQESVRNHTLDFSVLVCLVITSISLVWFIRSAVYTDNRPIKSIAKPMVTTKIRYINNPSQFIQTTANKRTYTKIDSADGLDQHNVTIIHHYSMPHAHRQGIYHVIKKYHYVYKNKFDKKYLSSIEGYSIGKNGSPYKEDKYYYVPRNIKVIQAQKRKCHAF